MDVREKLVELLAKYFDIGDSYAYNLTRVKSAFSCGTMGFDDFEEFDEETVSDIADHLISNGVTVQEWISVKEPPKEKGTYIVCTDNGGILLGHWYGTAWNAGGGAKKHLAYWMEKPQPPKGE